MARAAWLKLDVGHELTVAEGERVQLRPRGGGGAAVSFAWSGPRLESLASYHGTRGESPQRW